MAKTSLLLVDSDTRSSRVLEVSLRRAGFEVATADGVAAALEATGGMSPDLIVTESRLADGDGAELCVALRERTTAAVMFLSEDSTPDTKMRAIAAGADDFLAKPALVKDIVSRIQSLVERRHTEAIARRERPGNLSGTLANMGVVDLLQVMESGQKSGIVHLSSDRLKSGGFVSEEHARGTIFFRDGQVVDARLGNLVGLEAVYRMLLWEDGVFEIEFRPVSRPNSVQASTQAILLEGMRRVDEWSRYGEVLPPYHSRLIIDYGALNRSFSEVPGPMRTIVQLFDGRRTIFDVVNDSEIEDSAALEIISQLHEHSVLKATPKPSADTRSPVEGSVEAWLSTPSRAAAETVKVDLPSVLGRAMIPSPHSASEILRAESPLDRHDDPIPLAPSPDRTELPEPIGEPSIVLSRHTVPANRAVPLTETSRPAPSEPIPLTEPTRAPRLQIQRFSSVVAPAPMTARPMTATPVDDTRATVTDIPAPILPRPSWAEPAPALHGGPNASEAGTNPTLRPFAQVPGRFDPAEEPTPKPQLVPTQKIERPRAASYVIAPAAPPPWPVAVAARPASSVAPAPRAPAPRIEPLVQARAPATVDDPTEDGPELIDDATPTAGTPAPREVSKFNDEFFEKGGSEDLAWESDTSGVWKTRVLTVLFVAVIVAFVILVGKPGQENEVPLPAETAKAKPTAAWPKTPEGGVEVNEQPGEAAAPSPEAAAPAAPVAAAPVAAAPVAAAPVAAAPVAAAPVAAAPIAPAPPVAPAPVAAPAPPTPKPVAEKPPVAAEPERDSGKATALVEEGEAALQREQYAEARGLFTSAIKADGNNADAHSGLARAQLELGNDRSASGEAWKALKLDSKQARAHLVLAMIYQGKDDRPKAANHYRTYLKLAPSGAAADDVRAILKSLEGS